MLRPITASCLILISFLSLSWTQLPPLPTPEVFLENLFNSTATEVLNIVEMFNFHDVRSQDIKFLYFFPNETFKTLYLNSSALNILNVVQPIKFIVPGWGSTGDEKFIKDISKAYLSIGIKNVFAVDWSEHAKKEYVHASTSTKDVGKIVADFLVKLTQNNTKLFKHIHLIGHSLGAQIAGFAGRDFKKATGYKLGRITALDAAGPLFEFPVLMSGTSRLTRKDADYVDSFHTNAGFFGSLEPFAHADFYINNGGPVQPGCLNINILDSFACSHFRSNEVFTETITSKNFSATSCGNVLAFLSNLCLSNKKVAMGEHTLRNTTGIYFININGGE